MTFNIRNGLANDGPNSWEHRRHLTVKVIRESKTDIIGAQEVYDFQRDYLKIKLPEDSFYSVGREDGDKQGEQCTILWRADVFHPIDKGTFWLSDAPEIPNSMTWGNRITRICSWIRFSEGFYFYNTHWDHESVEARRRSAKMFIEQYSLTLPWILIGDFNAEPNSPEMDLLCAAGNCEFVSRDNTGGTFHDFQGGENGACIDHMLVGGGIYAAVNEVVRTSEDGIFPSDHYPVIFEVNLSEIPKAELTDSVC